MADAAGTPRRGVPPGIVDDGGRLPAAQAGTRVPAAAPGRRHSAGPRPARLPGARPLARHLMLLACYLAAGVAVTWPRAAYLTAGRVPDTYDQASYIWDFWWVAHQISHLGNPWFTRYLGAPAGIPLGFDTLMPLAGVVVAPVTLVWGPAVSYNLLAIVLPGLLCYVAYRAARLWLPSALGAVAAGAFYGLATMLLWQDWFHLNIAVGALFLPLALETTVRLSRQPRAGRAVVCGGVLGAAVLVNQESAVMAVLAAAAVLVAWLARDRRLASVRHAAIVAAVTAVIASPQLAAMAAQATSGGAAVSPRVMAQWDATFGVPLSTLFAPSPRAGELGLTRLAALYHYGQPGEGVPTFGVMLTVLGIGGLAAGWRRSSAWLLALGWAGAAALALGPVLVVGQRRLMVAPESWHGTVMSAVMPYTWLVRIPGLDGFREADRWALLGLLPAALLAGNAVAWLSRRAWPLLAVVLALAALEAGYSGGTSAGTMPAAMPRLDRAIAAGRSGSIVVDVPFGLRGGISPWGVPISPRALVMATADGHPRAVSYTSWVPASSVAALRAHPFYRGLVAAEHGSSGSAGQLRAARQDALRMRVGWAVAWSSTAPVLRYLRGAGFTFDYEVGGVAVYRLRSPDTAGTR